jgi:hypothetical protein
MPMTVHRKHKRRNGDVKKKRRKGEAEMGVKG